MASNTSGYDLSCNTYSPDGRVFQVEYALKAVEQSGVAVGIKCVDGVVLGVEKLIKSPLLVADSNRRIFTIAERTGLAFAGWNADGRFLAEIAKNEIMGYNYTFGIDPPPSVLSQFLGTYMHYYTCEGWVRPIGVSVLMTAYDERDKQAYLHLVEPSGVHHRYLGCSAGKSRPAVKSELEKLDLETITCAEALKQIARIVRIVHAEEMDKTFEFEASWISADTQWKHVPVPKHLANAADEWAKNKLLEEEGLMDVVTAE